jgi:hypothetical protein
MRFCTSDYAPHERVEAWREIYGRTLLKLEIEPIEVGAFHTDVRMRKVPGLGMITGSRSATFYRRNRIDNDDLVMSFGLGSGFEAMQFGRTETMQPGRSLCRRVRPAMCARRPAARRSRCASREPRRPIW